ncbi:MAG: IS200/IS605 family transposase [bacterium]
MRISRNKRTIRTVSHCFYDLKYHFVWTPKYRGKVLASDKVKHEVRRIFESICRWKHWEIVELSIQDDHIHLVLLATPRDSVSYVMQILKGKSSAWLKKKIKRTHDLYERQSLWARAGTSSPPSDSTSTSSAATYATSIITRRSTSLRSSRN